jgi:2'-5' RNA ligase
VTTRLFAAIRIDGGVADALKPLLAGLDGVRCMPPERLHLTLRFAGELMDDQCCRLRRALEEVQSPSVRIELEGVGSFDLGHGRGVVWAGVLADASLRHLQASCEAAARRAGLPRDERDWLPHVTFGYAALPLSAPLANWLERHRGFRAGHATASVFGLYESIRTGGESEYRLVQSYGLAA